MDVNLPDLEGQSAADILRWTFDRFSGLPDGQADRVAISTAFGPSGVVLLHLAQTVNPRVRAFFLDTGYHFPETLGMVERVRERLGIAVEVVSADPAVVSVEDPPGGVPLHARDTDRCCGIRKVDPTRVVLRGLDAWIAALRRDQGPTRAQTPVLEVRQSEGRDLVKVNPLVAWDRKRIWTYLFENDLPYNPLHDLGYPSVGCAPCTAPAEGASNEREGRWAGQAKLECGLHTRI